MYLIHNAYGTLCIIKTSSSSSGDKGYVNKGDIGVSKLYKVSNSNLFVSNVQSNISFFNSFDIRIVLRLLLNMEQEKMN